MQQLPQEQRIQQLTYTSRSMDLQSSSDSTSSYGTFPMTPSDHNLPLSPEKDHLKQSTQTQYTFSKATSTKDIPITLDPTTNMNAKQLTQNPTDLNNTTTSNNNSSHTFPSLEHPHCTQSAPGEESSPINFDRKTHLSVGPSIHSSLVTPFSLTTETIKSQAHTIQQQDDDDDIYSMDGSLGSIDCDDFPSPPSSTPSLVNYQTFTTNSQQEQHIEKDDTNYIKHTSTANNNNDNNNNNKYTSRFTEIFDVDCIELDWDYLTKNQQCSTISNQQQHRNDKNNNSSNNRNYKTLGGIITNIGRTASLSRVSSPTDGSRSSISISSSPSLRGIMRSFSTTGTHYQRSKKSNTLVEQEIGMSRAAQVVASTATTSNDILLLEEENDIGNSSNGSSSSINKDIDNNNDVKNGQRRKLSYLLSNTMKPTRRHTTKIVNLQRSPSSTPAAQRKPARRTVMSTNSMNEVNTQNLYAEIVIKSTQCHPTKLVGSQQSSSLSVSSAPKNSMNEVTTERLHVKNTMERIGYKTTSRISMQQSPPSSLSSSSLVLPADSRNEANAHDLLAANNIVEPTRHNIINKVNMQQSSASSSSSALHSNSINEIGIQDVYATNIMKSTRRNTGNRTDTQQSSTSTLSARKLTQRMNVDSMNTQDLYVDIVNLCQPHRPSSTPPTPPLKIAPYRYSKKLPLPPPPPSPTLSSSSTSSSSVASIQGYHNELDSCDLTLEQTKKARRKQHITQVIEQAPRLRQNMDKRSRKITNDETETGEQIEKSVLTLMGLEPDYLKKLPPPIPHRSPKRKPSIHLSSSSRTMALPPLPTSP
ncbi:uncharacterized protein BX664DRAFT_339414 [Halteromyces radiatus]|uniref:uncharacterized protein n=1 Tax=Halteromyces radiatus TaxID=101107 RepID=UPI00221F9AD2|nr:uncharacterized protein BX664DRAFT_339414 [Halteromyces radiatus]KAI8082920.1 hypothetical protein BX664DRAFT_339414 [Halteromyces radiatus]